MIIILLKLFPCGDPFQRVEHLGQIPNQLGVVVIQNDIDVIQFHVDVRACSDEIMEIDCWTGENIHLKVDLQEKPIYLLDVSHLKNAQIAYRLTFHQDNMRTSYC